MNSVDLPHNSVRALAKLFGHIVALIDDEILIEYLEDLSALKICHIMPGCGYLLPNSYEFLQRAQERCTSDEGEESKGHSGFSEFGGFSLWGFQLCTL